MTRISNRMRERGRSRKERRINRSGEKWIGLSVASQILSREKRGTGEGKGEKWE